MFCSFWGVPVARILPLSNRLLGRAAGFPCQQLPSSQGHLACHRRLQKLAGEPPSRGAQEPSWERERELAFPSPRSASGTPSVGREGGGSRRLQRETRSWQPVRSTAELGTAKAEDLLTRDSTAGEAAARSAREASAGQQPLLRLPEAPGVFSLPIPQS